MDPAAHHFMGALIWVPAYISLGILSYMLDLKWGVPVMRFVMRPFTKEGEPSQGFIVGRPRRTKVLVGLAISYGITFLLILHGSWLWYFETAWAFLEGLVCWIGMELGPVALVGFKVLGFTLDKVDALEASLKKGVPELMDSARAKGHEISDAAKHALETVSAPEEDSQAVTAAKIKKMDQLLGKKEPVERE
jgi:hypothetical protein